MALTKETVIDRVEVNEHGAVHVRRATYILEDGTRIAGPEYHRVAYAPGQDIAAEDVKVKAVASVTWTPAVIAAHQARMDAVTAALRGTTRRP